MTFLQRLRERFWFLPAVLCVGAAALAQLLVAVDRAVDQSLAPGWASAFVYRVGESGSRDILGAIASSSLAVAGTTFSITMAVLALTSSTYGPRLVRNFMADRGNQVVLGVYVATFLYSLLVLRAVRVLGDPGNQDAEVFVPHLAVNVAVLLAVANVAVLVYFIHHISDSIQVSTLTHRVRTDLLETIERLYPESIGRPVEHHHSNPRTPQPDLDLACAHGAPVLARGPGFVQSIEEDALLTIAQKHDTLLVLRVQPGDYVLEDTPLLLVHPGLDLTPEIATALRRTVHLADARTPYQDVRFAVQQLTEMAVRAVSPGTNDPYTAINALDDLGAGLTRLVSRQPPSPDRADTSGTRRVHAPRVEPIVLITDVIDAMRWYAASDPGVMHATLGLVAHLADATTSATLRSALVEQVHLLEVAFSGASHAGHDQAVFSSHADDVRRALEAT